MDSRVKTNINGLNRDLRTKAIINNNISDYNHILIERKRSQEIDTIKTELNFIQSEMNNMKKLLTEIRQKIN